MNKYITLAFISMTLVGCGSTGAGSSSGGMTKDLSVKIVTDKTEVAEGESLFFDSNVTGAEGTVSYTWKEGNSTLGTDKNLTKSDFTIGSHTIVLDVENGAKKATDSKTITVSEFLVSLISEKSHYAVDENVSIKADITGSDKASATYTWIKDGATVANDTDELNVTDFNASKHNVVVTVSINGIDKNASLDINVSDYSVIEIQKVGARKDEVLFDKDKNLMWVSDSDINKVACLAVHATKQDEINTSKNFCDKLSFADKNDWRKPTVDEISNFITTTIDANILPAYYAPCKILIGTDNGTNQAVITRYGKAKSFGDAGTIYKTMDEAIAEGKNIGLRCVRDNN